MKRQTIGAALWAGLILSLCTRPAPGQDEACLGCHASKESGAPQMHAAKLRESVHKDLGCSACHSGKDAYPHDPKAAKVSCDSCHQKSAAVIRSSDHGKLLLKTKRGAALCLACHGSAHELRPVADASSPVNHANIPETCDQCHQKLNFKEKFGLAPFASYAQTVHGRAILEHKNPKAAVCTDCHGAHDLDFSNNSRSRAYKFNIPQTCGRCHLEPLALYSRSIHAARAAAGVKEAPVCTDCHGEHNITAHQEPGSMVYTGSIVKTCNACHSSERLIAKFGIPLDPARAYLDSYHGVAFTAGNLSAANCASCHRNHDILPPEDPESSVNPQNLQRTCGACHRHAGKLVNLGKVHMAGAPASARLSLRQTVLGLFQGGERGSIASAALLRFVRRMYVWLIGLTIGGMLLHNGLYHQRKLLRGLEHAHDPDEMRLSRNERIQHWVLLLSFIGLAYTGFCHTYPESLLAHAVFQGAAGAAKRALLHRLFAGAFIALAAYHLGWLAITREGRRELGAMLPRWRDFQDFVQLQRYNVLHRGAAPRFGRFNYIEKAEYWALLWGSAVMIATGSVVWFREISLHYLPKWFFDLCLLIHFMEAVLACLAIIVWHFYWTVFDPEVYPMSWAWISGKVRRGSSAPRRYSEDEEDTTADDSPRQG